MIKKIFMFFFKLSVFIMGLSFLIIPFTYNKNEKISIFQFLIFLVIGLLLIYYPFRTLIKKIIRKRKKSIFIYYNTSIANENKNVTNKLLQIASNNSNIKKSIQILQNSEIKNSFEKFINKYYEDFILEISDGLLNWNNENCKLFFDLMKSKYKINDNIILTGIIYTKNEIDYKEFSDSFLDFKNNFNLDKLFNEIVLFDIYNSREINIDYINRLLKENYSIKFTIKKIISLYQKAKDNIKSKQFEDNLNTNDLEKYKNIEDQIKIKKLKEDIDSALKNYSSINPSDYIIVGQDYGRDSKIDKYYKKHFSYALSKVFSGLCSKCGQGMGYLEFDHFWLPKSKGGNFIMRSKNGYYINNCIPLCKKCNSSKGKKSYESFFAKEQLLFLFEKNQDINSYINQNMKNFDDADFIGRRF